MTKKSLSAFYCVILFSVHPHDFDIQIKGLSCEIRNLLHIPVNFNNRGFILI